MLRPFIGRELEESRMIAHVMRELRRQKIRIEKRKNKDTVLGDTPPTITVRELADLFPTLSDGIIRSRLKDRCSCVSYKARSLRMEAFISLTRLEIEGVFASLRADEGHSLLGESSFERDV